MNFDSLIKFLEKREVLSKNDKEKIAGLFTEKQINKGELLLHNGDICNEIYFINKGLLRAFYHTDKGVEFTRLIKTENEFCSNLQSFSARKPSLENIQALEDSTILVITYEDFVKFINSSSNGMSIYRKILEEFQSFHITRFEFLTSNSAQNKVHLFLKSQANLAQRISSKVAASYLQMTPETYSRIKNKLKA